MSFKDQIAKIESDLAALKAHVEAEKNPKTITVFDGWKPGKGDNYCCVYLANPQPFTVSRNDGHNVDDLRIKRCIGLRTSAQAEAAADAIFVMLELRNQPGAGTYDDSEDGWVAQLAGKELDTDFWGKYKAQAMLCPPFGSEEQLAAALDAVGRDRVERALRVWAMLPVEVQS